MPAKGTAFAPTLDGCGFPRRARDARMTRTDSESDNRTCHRTLRGDGTIEMEIPDCGQTSNSAAVAADETRC